MSYSASGWSIILLDEVEEWFLDLAAGEPASAHQVAAAIDLLQDQGPMLGRPLVDRVKSSRLHNLKELRPGSKGLSQIRVLFIFDPLRRAVLLVAGDKSRDWRGWYVRNIPVAESRYDAWQAGEYEE